MKTNVLSSSNRLSVSSHSVKTCLSAGIGLFLAAAAPSLMATNYFFDNFDSGVSGSTWAAVAGANIFVMVGDNAHTYGGSAGSAKQVNADPFIYYMRAINGWSAGTVQPGQAIVADVKFWDDNTPFTGQPLGGGIMLASDNSLTDFYQLLVNSGTAIGGNATDYIIRSKANGNVDSHVLRSQGWHDFAIEVLPYTGANDVQYYIDGSLVGTLNRENGDLAMTELRLGLSVKTAGSPFWFDNVSVDTVLVPEPSSLVMLGLGGLALLLPGRTARKRG